MSKEACPGGAGPGGPGGSSRYEVAWRGDALWIFQETYAAAAGGNMRRGETWRLDDRGRLIISVETRRGDEAAMTRTLAYQRRKNQGR